MVERRKPLILSSTRCLVDSVLNSLGTRENEAKLSLRLPAGILRLNDSNSLITSEKEEEEKLGIASFDDSAVVGLSSSVLKKLSMTSGSLVFISNIGTKVQRIARVIVLDSPKAVVGRDDSDHIPHTMVVFPTYMFSSSNSLPLVEVTYISPLLAFNLELHVSCLKCLVHGGQETLTSLFEEKKKDKNESPIVDVDLSPCSYLPKYASHLRASFVKVPECGTIETLKGTSSIESEYRQRMIDSELHDYFKVDRYLGRGDIFRININWNCKSEMCTSCCQRSPENSKNNIIYFKVLAMEPQDEPVLRVNREKTALVLGGSVPSALPPVSLIGGQRGYAPLHGDTVRSLASILTPALCPSALSSKFRVGVLLCGLAGCGKRTVVRYVARCLGLHVVEYTCHDLMVSEKRASAALVQAFNTADRYAPTILLLRHFEVFQNLSSHEGSSTDQLGATAEVASVIREFTEPVPDGDFDREERTNGGFSVGDAVKITGRRVLLVAIADTSEGLPTSIRRCFSHELNMGPLSEEQRVEMLTQSLQSVSKVDMADIVKDMVGQTSGFMPRDIKALVADAGANLIPRLTDESIKQRESNDKKSVKFDLAHDNDPSKDASKNLGREDITKALDRSKKRNASALGTPKVPNVKWEDVGGLEDVKNSILDTVQLPLLHKDLFSSGLRKRSGVLLYGPPGTGKTLLAKAVATECSLNFLSVKGPELINMYIGESEKNIRDIFQKARSARPCVIFFDELDSLAPARGASGDSGGVMDRVVSQMLAEIDGLNDSSQDLFIIGASNRPDLIDPALLRPGRFDKLLYVGVNSDASYRENVLAALTRKFKLHENVDLYFIAKKCPSSFTGADMYALCADAWFHAAKRKVSCLEENDQSDSVIVELDDFIKVLGELSPSLSGAELKKYQRLRDQFEGAKK
ncbi:peroxisome biogenesis protein 6-like [Papaver somniferum]|uniref:peroxisome biogenesis protein 6-like n=1 Tax=Papaver somniferum TaxID=3469 RepID=UPI000E6FB070|nr:peroxisome biogenesis protein 6-like [Papaver somniferum]